MIVVTTALLLTICSQNLQLYSLPDGNRNVVVFYEKEQALLERMIAASCDVIAVQELVGGEKALARLATLLKLKTGLRLKTFVGAGSDVFQQLGFIVNIQKLKFLRSSQHLNSWLPTISRRQRPRTMLRAPLEIVVKSRFRKAEEVTLFNIHLKSKYRSQDDPARLKWETYRMESAEYVRRLAENRKGVVLILGDRNSGIHTATTKILTGKKMLNDFSQTGMCEVLNNGTPICKTKSKRAIFLSALLKESKLRSLGGTYTYKGIKEWLDDILINRGALRSVKVSGVINAPETASDHDMVVVRLKIRGRRLFH